MGCSELSDRLNLKGPLGLVIGVRGTADDTLCDALHGKRRLAFKKGYS